MKFHVPDMSCNHCVSSITKAVHTLSPDANVVCDLNDRVVQIEGLDTQGPDVVTQALSDIGFDSTLVQAQA